MNTLAKPSVEARRETPPRLALLALAYLRFRQMLSIRSVAGILIGLLIIVGLTLTAVENEWSFLNFLFGTVVVKVIPILCLVVGGGELREELKEGTIEYLWTRPIRKVYLVLGSYVSGVLRCAPLAFGSVGAALAIAAFKGLNLPWAEVAGTAFLATALSLLTFSALIVALGTIAARYMVIGVSYGVTIEVAVSQIPSVIGNISVSRHIRELWSIRHGADRSMFEIGDVGGALLGCGVIGAIGLAVACLVFSVRRYSVGSGGE